MAENHFMNVQIPQNAKERWLTGGHHAVCCDSPSVNLPVTYFSSPTFAAIGVDKFAEYVVATSNYTISVTRPSKKASCDGIFVVFLRDCGSHEL